MLFRIRTLLILFSLAAPASAEITNLSVNAYTSSYESGNQSLYLWVEFKHTRLRPPDAVAKLRVIAPDGTLIDMVDGTWEEWWKGFGAYLGPDDFDTGSIPSGNYRFQVREKGTPAQIQILDRVDATFLPIPYITSPSVDEQVGSLNPTITWEPVAGAKYYRVEINWGNSSGSPIYGMGRNLTIIGGSTSFTIPNGVLRPGNQYQVRVRARDTTGWESMDKESRSNWVNFTTAP